MQNGEECEIWDDETGLSQSDFISETMAPK